VMGGERRHASDFLRLVVPAFQDAQTCEF
jgi:hypothetical protein